MDLKDNILQRIDELLGRELGSPSHVSEIAAGTISLIQLVYGANSTQLEQMSNLQKQLHNSESTTHGTMIRFQRHFYGVLQTLKSDIEEGRIADLQAEARGEVFGDFIALARRALDDEEMATVINALRSAGAVDKTEGAVLKGYTQVRNKAFHAEWNKIDVPSITGIIAFTEKFLIKHFSS